MACYTAVKLCESVRGNMIVTSLFVILIGAVAVDAVIENVARGKPAYMSSQHLRWGANRGVDGKTNGWDINNCFHTKSAAVNWWYVDLGANYPVRLIELFNRSDCCSDRASNMELWIGTSLDNLTKVKTWSSLSDYSSYLSSDTVAARYVKLVQKNNTYFHLCEVKVYAQW